MMIHYRTAVVPKSTANFIDLHASVFEAEYRATKPSEVSGIEKKSLNNNNV